MYLHCPSSTMYLISSSTVQIDVKHDSQGPIRLMLFLDLAMHHVIISVAALQCQSPGFYPDNISYMKCYIILCYQLIMVAFSYKMRNMRILFVRIYGTSEYSLNIYKESCWSCGQLILHILLANYLFCF